MRLATPLPRITPDDPRLSELIGAERVRMLYAPTTLMILMSTAFTVALVALIGNEAGWGRCLLWALACLVMGGARLLHARAYHRAEDRQHPRWRRSLIIMCGLHGAVWGTAGIWLMPVHDLITTAVVVATLIGAGAICTFALQADVAPNMALNIPMMLPAGVMLATRLDGYGLFGSAGLIGLGVVMLLESRRAERRIVELLWLRFTTDRISQERADALKLAQRHAAIKDQFLATMSHEMRTPLHGILGLAQLVQQRLPDRPGVIADARQHAALIQRSGEHLLTLINDVLDFSRIEAGRLVVDQAPFELRALLEDVLALARLSAKEKGLALQTHIELPQPCWVMGDAARVRQVLFNLLGNAVKFTEVGQISLTVARQPAASASESRPPQITFEVRDTGVGIPPDMTERVFEAFQQANNTFGRKHQGTGLGLTISRELARAMRGDLLCLSHQGPGSCFAFAVPLPEVARTDIASTALEPAIGDAGDTRPSEPPLLPAALTPADKPSALPIQLRGKVLLVEDNAVNAMVAEAAIAHLGLEVTLATDGQQALNLLVPGPHDFDLVLMDCQMPVLDGIEATRRLRVHEQDIGCPNVPVIALTANATPHDRQRCAAAGMDDHLAKPFKQEELAAVLRQHLVSHALTA
jgi:signal transduction histidine kinase/ActR/RegA family two-component response regulator